MIAVRATIMIVSSLVVGAVVGLGAAATLLERAATVPFDGDGDGDGGGTAAPARRPSHPFEGQAA